jgi:Uma2 family endonuclease
VITINRVSDESGAVQYKASLYARAGVPEYWIVDLARGTLAVHREPLAAAAPWGWRYGAIQVLGPLATMAPLAGPGAGVPVADLLP